MNNRTFLTSLADSPASGKAVLRAREQPVLMEKSGKALYAIANHLPLSRQQNRSEKWRKPGLGDRLRRGTPPQRSRCLLEMGKRSTPLTTFRVTAEDGNLYGD
jgi:hypothetical protein